MKIPLLNPTLTSDRVLGVRFPFSPIAIPCDVEGKVCEPSPECRTHYATLVLVTDRDYAPAILEFGQEVMDGLQSYARRHQGLASMELLISREENGIRLRVGRMGLEDDAALHALPYQDAANALYSKYYLGRHLIDVPRKI